MLTSGPESLASSAICFCRRAFCPSVSARIAGSTLGAFNFFGAAGTMISGVLGGYLYDKWMPGGPFLMMGIASFLLMVACIVVRLREPKV